MIQFCLLVLSLNLITIIDEPNQKPDASLTYMITVCPIFRLCFFFFFFFFVCLFVFYKCIALVLYLAIYSQLLFSFQFCYLSFFLFSFAATQYVELIGSVLFCSNVVQYCLYLALRQPIVVHTMHVRVLFILVIAIILSL